MAWDSLLTLSCLEENKGIWYFQKEKEKEGRGDLRDRQLPQEDPNGLSLPGFHLGKQSLR